MNITNPYWNGDPMFLPHKGLAPINNHGFFFKLPHRDVQTAGFYFGENPGYGRRELASRSDPEYFAVQGKIPASGGVPQINPKNPIYKFKRSDFVQKFTGQ